MEEISGGMAELSQGKKCTVCAAFNIKCLQNSEPYQPTNDPKESVVPFPSTTPNHSNSPSLEQTPHLSPTHHLPPTQSHPRCSENPSPTPTPSFPYFSPQVPSPIPLNLPNSTAQPYTALLNAPMPAPNELKTRFSPPETPLASIPFTPSTYLSRSHPTLSPPPSYTPEMASFTPSTPSLSPSQTYSPPPTLTSSFEHSPIYSSTETPLFSASPPDQTPLPTCPTPTLTTSSTLTPPLSPSPSPFSSPFSSSPSAPSPTPPPCLSKKNLSHTPNIHFPFSSPANLQMLAHSDPPLPILDVMTNFIHKLQTTNSQDGQFFEDLKFIQNLIDSVLNDRTSIPKEISIKMATVIVDPQTIRVRDCNKSFLKIFGKKTSKQRIMKIDIKKAFKPFLRQLMVRDFAWFLATNITSAERYMIFPHHKGDVVYGLGTFEVFGPHYAIISLSTLFEDMPNCLQVTYQHYLGISQGSVVEPIPECTMKYCHCKMLHLPLPSPPGESHDILK